ncbi:polysaccharide deacetylase family protein [Bradyrhizobium sp. 2TAF24]|uniref:polysaccharide deacetylase family protein n=1 Tax=Bradyrhizobium sp. 2TAF24 TaxID=3233011 RepID=UPI003F90EB33
MTSPVYMTTSWDDGHPADLRVAALLTKYGIAGTFYVPEATDRDTLSAVQLRELASAFEIGAHTLHHVDLTRVANDIAWQEIVGSKSWVEDHTGVPCVCFCPPIGHYAGVHIQMVRRAGYLGLRTTEFLSLDVPRPQAGLLLMPTTVQAFPHGLVSFTRNAVKRFALAQLWRYVVHGCPAEWPTLAELLLHDAVVHGGVFHLWGHSWEIQDLRQWQRLDDVLRFMGSLAYRIPAVTNGQLCRLFAPLMAASDQPAHATRAASARG